MSHAAAPGWLVLLLILGVTCGTVWLVYGEDLLEEVDRLRRDRALLKRIRQYNQCRSVLQVQQRGHVPSPGGQADTDQPV